MSSSINQPLAEVSRRFAYESVSEFAAQGKLLFFKTPSLYANNKVELVSRLHQSITILTFREVRAS
jgi:hypothetical protein